MKVEDELSDELQARLATELQRLARNSRIQCAAALAIARALDIPARAVGRAADQLHIKIGDCQLGCF